MRDFKHWQEVILKEMDAANYMIDELEYWIQPSRYDHAVWDLYLRGNKHRKLQRVATCNTLLAAIETAKQAAGIQTVNFRTGRSTR